MNWIKKILGGNDKEKLTISLEKIYSDLRTTNPNKDEHWFLANTWLKKYENWETPKHKGTKWKKYVAYTTTFQFSLLDTPQSIRGLILYLLSKELGEKAIENEIGEFTKIVELSQKIQEKDELMDKYKQKNPFTWNEVATEKDSSTYGLYGFLMAADNLNKNPGERERVLNEIENLEINRSSEKPVQDIKFSEEQIAEIKRAINKDK